jgi:hypothetical protein
MLVGDPFAAKTKVLNVLAQTLTLMTERGHGDENINKVIMIKVRSTIIIRATVIYRLDTVQCCKREKNLMSTC